MPVNLLSLVSQTMGPLHGIFLFGSRVTGNVDEHSDIDVIALADDVPSLRRKKIPTPHGVLDVHLHSAASLRKAWQEQRKRYISFYTHALATGEILLDVTGELRVLAEESRQTWPKQDIEPDWTVYRLALMAKLGDIRRSQATIDAQLLAVDTYQTILAVHCLQVVGWLASALLMRRWCSTASPAQSHRLDQAFADAIAGTSGALAREAEACLLEIGGPLSCQEALTWSGLAA